MFFSFYCVLFGEGIISLEEIQIDNNRCTVLINVWEGGWRGSVFPSLTAAPPVIDKSEVADGLPLISPIKTKSTMVRSPYITLTQHPSDIILVAIFGALGSLNPSSSVPALG